MIGETVGQYRIIERLGEGGMGEVYLAEDLKLRRKAAIKIIAPHLTRDAARRQRFVQEALVAASIDHPHIAAIYDVDQVGDRTYIAMEYVRGETLRQKLRGGPLKARRAIDLCVEIGDALAKVHERGVIHRDLKPENVIVSEDGYAKVIDFGLAKLTEPVARGDASQGLTTADPQVRTADGLVLGTVAYMSPEQARGETVDARSDIFSFGVLLHELLTGTAPFRRKSAAETLSAILSDATPPLQIDEAGSSADLQRIVRKCLTKDPAARYQTMRDLVVDLRDVREGLGSVSRSVEMPAARPKASKRVVLGIAAAVIVVSMGGALATWMLQRRTTTAPAAAGPASSGRPVVAVVNFENLAASPDIAWLSKGLPSMIVTGLAQTPDLELVSTQRLNDAARELGKDTLDAVDRSQYAQVAQRAGARILVSGSIVRAGNDYRIDARVEDVAAGRVVYAGSVRGTDVLSLADDLAARIRQGLDVRTTAPVHRVADVSSSSVEAYRLYTEGTEALDNARFDDARKLLGQAVAVDPAFSRAYLELADIAQVDGDAPLNRQYLDRAAEHLDRLSERDAWLIGAGRAAAEGRFDESIRLYETVVSRYPDTERAYTSLSFIYNPVFGAVPDANKELSILTRGVQRIPTSPGMQNLYGYAQLDVGRLDEAIATYQTYIRLRPNEPNAPDSLADAYLAAGDAAKAIEAFTRAFDAGREGSRSGRAWAHAMRGEYDEALRDLPGSTFTKAFVLSRVGRFKDADATIQEVRTRIDSQRSAETAAAAVLLQANIALDRGDCRTAVRQGDAARPVATQAPRWLARRWLVLADLLAGACEARSGSADRAQARLDRIKLDHLAAAPHERWWVQALEGEIALANGKPVDAAAAFAAGEPSGKMPSARVGIGTPLSIFSSGLVIRDGRARALAAQGRDAEAIQIYRDLLTPSRTSKWTAMLEPRHVLALARLLDKTGQRDAAHAEYQRFLDLWKQADPGLPEVAEARRGLAR